MTSLELQERIEFLNSQYLDNAELIERLQDKLMLDIIQLKLNKKDLYQTREYINDKVTIFRFLREVRFDFDKANARLLSTIQWRLDWHIADLTFEDCVPFFGENALTFFHGQDNANHPLLFVRLACFPTVDKSKTLTEHIRPYACLIMEMARKFTWDMTCDRESRGEIHVLVSQFAVLVNVSKTPFIPVDANLIKTISEILEVRFPGFIYRINVLNFSWLYQGLWSVIRLLLNEQAKRSIQFTSINELQPIISSDRIIQEMGGTCDYIWSKETDQVLQKYGRGSPSSPPVKAVELPNTPPLSTSSTELREIPNTPTSSEEEDVFFDATDTPPLLSQSPTPMTPPPTSQKLISPSPLPGTVRNKSNSFYYGSLPCADLLHSVIIDSKKPRPRVLPDKDTNSSSSSSVILVEPPIQVTTTRPSTNILQRVLVTGQQCQNLLKQLTHHLLRLSFGPNRGIFYWFLLYVFLRMPVEMLVKRSLMRSPLTGTQRLTTTTIGITAVIAATMGTGLLSTLERFKK